MNNRNNSNDGSNNQSQPLSSPFGALIMVEGMLGLRKPEPTMVEAQKAAAITPTPKPVVRQPVVMPRRGSTRNTARVDSAPIAPALHIDFGTVTDDQGRAELILNASAAQTSATTAPVTEVTALTGWDLLEQHKKSGKAIRGHVTRVIHSRQSNSGIVGIKVRVAGLEGFVPFRMLGLNQLDTEHSVTLEMGFRVVELEKGKDGGKDRIILNRQMVMAEEKSAALIRKVKVGDIVSGVIRNLKPFGAFIDIDGASALNRVSELPQGNTSSVKVGQRVTAIVVKADPNSNQLGVSIKHYFVSQLAVGAEFTGRVKNEESFGVFVQLDETVDGLVHVSQFGDFTPTSGDIATVKVLSTNKEKGQVQLALLGVKAAQAD